MLTSQFNENVSLTRQQHCSADVRGIVQASLIIMITIYLMSLGKEKSEEQFLYMGI